MCLFVDRCVLYWSLTTQRVSTFHIMYVYIYIYIYIYVYSCVGSHVIYILVDMRVLYRSLTTQRVCAFYNVFICIYIYIYNFIHIYIYYVLARMSYIHWFTCVCYTNHWKHSVYLHLNLCIWYIYVYVLARISQICIGSYVWDILVIANRAGVCVFSLVHMCMCIFLLVRMSLIYM